MSRMTITFLRSNTNATCLAWVYMGFKNVLKMVQVNPNACGWAYKILAYENAIWMMYVHLNACECAHWIPACRNAFWSVHVHTRSRFKQMHFWHADFPYLVMNSTILTTIGVLLLLGMYVAQHASVPNVRWAHHTFGERASRMAYMLHVGSDASTKHARCVAGTHVHARVHLLQVRLLVALTVT